MHIRIIQHLQVKELELNLNLDEEYTSIIEKWLEDPNSEGILLDPEVQMVYLDKRHGPIEIFWTDKA